MIFVGGPLHGQDIDITPQQPAVVGQPPTMPPAYDDLASGGQWRLFPCRWLGPRDPTTGIQPDLTRHVYVHTDLLANAMPQVQQLITNAVMTWWFVSGGTPTTLPASNGHRAVYLAVCPACEETHSFESLKGRAAWAAQHIAATGHSITFSQQAEEATP